MEELLKWLEEQLEVEDREIDRDLWFYEQGKLEALEEVVKKIGDLQR